MRPTVCKVCNRRTGPIPHTVCKLCHSGCHPDFRETRPTVCKVCNSGAGPRLATGDRQLATGHSVQGVPFGAPLPTVHPVSHTY